MKSSSRCKLLITGGGFVNKGAEAMVCTVAEALFPLLASPVEISIDRGLKQYLEEPKSLRFVNEYSAAGAFAWFSRILAWRKYLRYKFVIDVGGFQIGDDWHPSFARRIARRVRMYQSGGAQVIFMPQAYGPFTKPETAAAARPVFQNLNRFYVRDQASWDAVSDLLGGVPENMLHAPDIAWNFASDSPSEGRNILQKVTGAELSGPLTVAITPNLRVYERSPGVGMANRYLCALKSIVEHLVTRFSARVVLLGHQLSPVPGKTDDRTLCRLLHEAVGPDKNVFHVDAFVSAKQVKAILGNCDFLVSSRYHALIAALSQHVPAAAIGWSHKYGELLSDAGIPEFSLDINKTDAEITAKLEGMILSRSDIQARLAAKVPALKRAARLPLDWVSSLLPK